jgi:hypothetical protein|tara:strand:- start:396 stop:1160 length:765 start_codon:yes stop_codon:yes gene_type:complete
MPDIISMDESQADAPELNADEQESLAIGEQMQAADDQLLAGKYNSVQDLEKGYLEAQKMLSNRGSEEQEESSEEETEASDDSKSVSFLNDAATEYREKGELSEETMASLVEMSSEDLVAAYLEAQVDGTPSSVELSTQDVKYIQDSVGGEQGYQALVGWASENLPEQSIQGFDALVESGNAAAIELAVAGLYSLYENQNGSDGQMITGKAPSTSGDRFRSQAEVVAAMSDARYDNDPAYRDAIIQKLERSDDFF